MNTHISQYLNSIPDGWTISINGEITDRCYIHLNSSIDKVLRVSSVPMFSSNTKYASRIVSHSCGIEQFPVEGYEEVPSLDGLHYIKIVNESMIIYSTDCYGPEVLTASNNMMFNIEEDVLQFCIDDPASVVNATVDILLDYDTFCTWSGSQ